MDDAPSIQRRLAAILAGDLAGYSRLMHEDEPATVRDLKSHQSVILPLIGRHGGRIIDTADDGIMAEFRVGFNLGDVIHDETRIYGDGINIPARLEALAQPGLRGCG